jgi:hypothetical protein
VQSMSSVSMALVRTPRSGRVQVRCCPARHAAMQCNASHRDSTRRGERAAWRRCSSVASAALPGCRVPCELVCSLLCVPVPVCAFARMCSSEWRVGERDGGVGCAVALNAAYLRLTALGFSRSSPSEVARAAELFIDRAPPRSVFLSPGLGTHRPADRRVAQQTASRARGVFGMRLRRRHLRRRCRRRWPPRRRTPHGGG